MNQAEEPFAATNMPDREWWQALWPNPVGVLRQLGIEPRMTVVDLCCGDGYFTAPLSALVRGKLYAVDLDPTLLARAKAEARRQDVRVRRWICADARNIDRVLGEKVHFVLLANTFHGVGEKTNLARAVAAVLHPRGLFAVVNWHPLPRERTQVLGQPRGPSSELRMSIAQVRQAVEPAGFALEDLVELPPFHYGAVFRLRDVEP